MAGATREELLAAVLAAPDDDDRRRVYADRLLADGDPRGELIQVQLALAAIPATDREKRLELERRETRLVKDETQQLKRRFAAKSAQLRFARGFVESLRIGAPLLPAIAADLAATEPVRELHVTRFDAKHAQAIVTLPLMARLRTLDLSNGNVGPTAAGAIAASPQLAGLRSLVLRRAELRPVALRFLGAGRLAALESLDLSENAFGDEGLAAFAETPLASRLTSLDVTWCGATEQGFAALAKVDLSRLARFRARNNDLGADGLAALLANATFRPRELDVSVCRLGDDGLKRLLAWDGFERLEVLSIDGNGISALGTAYLAASPRIDGLRILEAGLAIREALRPRLGDRVRFRR